MTAHRRNVRRGVVVALCAVTTFAFAGADASDAFGRARPVIAVVAENNGTELIDFVVPYGVLAESGVAEVRSVATHDGTVRMRPALSLRPDDTTASFDAAHPDGADFVVVPAVSAEDRSGNPTLIAWLRSQAARGATIVSICDGALVVAEAGLLAGHDATAHWASRRQREKSYADTSWQSNTRYVVDGKRISSAGVSAALPLSIALVETIAGHEAAAALATRLGVARWDARHDSDTFRLGGAVYWTALRNWIWPSQEVELPLVPGVSEVDLALMSDAFSRTFRSQAVLVAASAADVRTRNGLLLVPDRIVSRKRAWRPLDAGVSDVQPGKTLQWTLDRIGQRYGAATARFVALQLEYDP